MLKFVNKRDYWNIEDKGILKVLPKKFPWHLKSVQDAMVLNELFGESNLKIAEVGGGDSRILEYMNANNSCYNIDYFRGEDGGPDGEISINQVQNIFAHMGEYSSDLQDDFFDIVFSVSVVEHVTNDDLPDFFKDCIRILKPGGKMIHLIDLYIEDDEKANHFSRSRVKIYESVFRDKLLQPCGDFDVLNTSGVNFSASYVTNPDDMMHTWNTVAPALRTRREISQSVAIMMMGTKAH